MIESSTEDDHDIKWNGMKAMSAAGATQNALIVVDPGFSKFSLKIAGQISAKLTRKGYAVTLITANRFQAEGLSKVNLLVLGGPTYVGQPSGRIKQAVQALSNGTKLKTLIFVTGGSDCSGLAPLNQLAAEKGLAVVGSCGILDKREEASNIEPKINQLLEII